MSRHVTQVPDVITLGGIKPHPLLLGGHGEAEALPIWAAEFVPQVVGVLESAPERGGSGFPDLPSALVCMFAYLAPGTVRAGEEDVSGAAALLVENVPVVDLSGHGQVGEEPDDQVFPWPEHIKLGSARSGPVSITSHGPTGRRGRAGA